MINYIVKLLGIAMIACWENHPEWYYIGWYNPKSTWSLTNHHLYEIHPHIFEGQTSTTLPISIPGFSSTAAGGACRFDAWRLRRSTTTRDESRGRQRSRRQETCWLRRSYWALKNLGRWMECFNVIGKTGTSKTGKSLFFSWTKSQSFQDFPILSLPMWDSQSSVYKHMGFWLHKKPWVLYININIPLI
jgi:hypothetical protein